MRIAEHFSSTKSIAKKVCILAAIVVAISSCGTLRDSPKYQLGNDVYGYRQKGQKYQSAKVYVKEDSIIVTIGGEQNRPDLTREQFFLKKSFDVDVMTVAFKYRPIQSGLPRQLTTDFNGNVFLGYRFDRFKLADPFGLRPNYGHRAFTGGVFAGIGSTAITPWTTANRTSDEYNGLILTRGLALMFGVNTLTVGIGIDWDNLTDRDRKIWIYQGKPWYGLAVGLNLN